MIGRGAMLAVTALGVGATALPQIDDRPPRLVWNASASVPVGLYDVERAGPLRAGELVVVTPPEPLANFLADGARSGRLVDEIVDDGPAARETASLTADIERLMP